MKKILFSISAVLLCTAAIGNPGDSTTVVQAVQIKMYHVNRPLALSIIGVGIVSDVFAIPRIKSKQTISDDEIANLNPRLLNTVDLWALNQNPVDQKIYRHISDYGLVPLILMPGVLLFNKNVKKDWWNMLLMYTEGHAVTFSFYNYSFLGPTFQSRYRPMTYYTEFTMQERESGNNRNSFYSGHVATTAYSSFFMAKVYCDYHPKLKAKKYLFYALAMVPPLAMSYCRVESLDHFPSDDAVGFLLGASLGIIIPALHKNHSPNLAVGMFTSPYGNGLSVKWILAGKHSAEHSGLSNAIGEDSNNTVEKKKF